MARSSRVRGFVAPPWRHMLVWLGGSLILGTVFLAVTLLDPRFHAEPTGWMTWLFIGVVFPIGGIGLALLVWFQDVL